MSPTIEEIEDDIDNMDFDPADFDPRSLRQSAASSAVPPQTVPSSSTAPRSVPTGTFPVTTPQGVPILSDNSDMSEFKSWIMIYPVYFDISKSRDQGRRVSKKLAVENPLAQTLADAVKLMGLRLVFEIAKTHPKDWANPGRLRVELPENHPKIKNKRHMFVLLAQYLKAHPVDAKAPFKSSIYQQMMTQGMQFPPEASPLAVPRGGKINSVLPLNSRALSSGEENEEMMKQMQSQMFPGLNMPDMKPKKIKIRR